jgi:CRISPR-associated endonuclease/helicase Cas3
MNILIISRCTKKAREESCRIIDQFAERTGDAAWQTAITLDGVNTLRKLLRKTARRNTAVACHWLKKTGKQSYCGLSVIFVVLTRRAARPPTVPRSMC